MLKEFIKELGEIMAYQGRKLLHSRLFLLTLVVGMMLFSLVVHLFRLQIIEGESAQGDVQKQVIREISLESSRGNIYDRNGVLLAYNKLINDVTITDNGEYSNGYQKNVMLLDLIEILDRYDEEIEQTIPIFFEDGVLKNSFSTTNSRLRFLRDMYGYTSVDKLSEEERAASDQDILDYYKDKFGVGLYEDGTSYEVTDEDALKCIYIRYGMMENYYTRYQATTIAEDISQEAAAAIIEHSLDLKGVTVENTYKRYYNDSVYFSHIIGYTGKASNEEIDELNSNGGDYVSGDIIGKAGIEASMETYLHGTKGSQSMYVNNLGQIKQIIDQQEPVAGDDIYLSIDHDLTVGIYHLIEQQLASILVNKLVDRDVDYINDAVDLKNHYIPIKKAYFQLINNNVINMDKLSSDDAGEAGQRVYAVFSSRQAEILQFIESDLRSESPSAYEDLTEDMQSYYDTLYSVLISNGIIQRDLVDTSDETYRKYRSEGSISLQEYLRHALSQGWIDVSSFSSEETYVSTEDSLKLLIERIMDDIRDDSALSKKIYEKLIMGGQISRGDLGLVLYEQGALPWDADWVNNLTRNGNAAAYPFMLQCISEYWLTPAQLALDPCSGSVTVTDIHTGKVLALVAYPGYDNNRITNYDYYQMLLEDQSAPLFNKATQGQTAPGSIFKLVSTAIGMEEGTITRNSTYTTHGIFTKVGMSLKCVAFPDNHGTINAVKALEVSCNDFFCQLAYDFSQEDGNYNDAKGLALIQKYAKLMGLGEKTGIEIAEYSPKISNTSAIASAIGQGTNLFSNVQLARYVTTVASKGNIYNMTLLDHRTNAEGELQENYQGEVVSHTEFSDETWNVIFEGMYDVVHESYTSTFFSGNVEIAGKTGTAQENALRPDHANFISFAPFDNPEISVAVSIPYGYTSNNSAKLAGKIYDYYYGYLTVN